MVSRENTVIMACISLAVLTLYATAETVTLPPWARSAILLGIGVIAPLVINEYLDTKES